MTTDQLWIEPVGDIIVARVRGTPTEALLKECHERILVLLRDTQRGNVLYDCLELDAPAIEIPMAQWKLDEEIETMNIKRAIVVPNTRLAYLARIAFGEGNQRVFYNDLTAAIKWLSDDSKMAE